MLTTEYSRAVQDYVKAVYVLARRQRPVPNRALKPRLGTTAPAVSEMAHQLVERGLLRRVPYHGVVLTEQGEELARRLVRDHVLVERWLVELLDVMPDDAHVEAERLEHALSDRLAARLEARLMPHGQAACATDPCCALDVQRSKDSIPGGDAVLATLVTTVPHDDIERLPTDCA